MVKKSIHGVYHSPLLTDIPGLIHGYSTRALGDMRKSENKQHFFDLLGLDSALTAFPQQVHGDGVYLLKGNEIGIINGVDGVVRASFPFHSISIRVADCVPLIAVDPKKRIIGAAHAGWKGTKKTISKKLIEEMKKLGANTDDIVVSVGPHIGKCCYDVPRERAQEFMTMYADKQIIFQEDHRWYLDIGYINYLQLRECGITNDHIEISKMCTSCQIKEFFSYRKDTKETFGEMVGVIGFIKT